MSSFLDSKSTMDFSIDEQPQSLSLDRRKNVCGGEQSSPIKFKRPNETSYLASFRMALLVACIIVFLISIPSYDPSHSPPASQDIFSSVCFPKSSCLLPLYLPNVLVNPPAIVFVTSVLGFFTLAFEVHGIRRADIYQDQILAFGVICGFIWCGILTFKGEGVSAFKNFMPGIITATFATSAMIHTFLERTSSI